MIWFLWRGECLVDKVEPWYIRNGVFEALNCFTCDASVATVALCSSISSGCHLCSLVDRSGEYANEEVWNEVEEDL